jgi:putative endopeptidase
VRPQDDLFRHRERQVDRPHTEIPSDQGPLRFFHALAEEAEKAVREIIVETRGSPARRNASSATSTRAALAEARINELGAAPLTHDLASADAISDIPSFLRGPADVSSAAVSAASSSSISITIRATQHHRWL